MKIEDKLRSNAERHRESIALKAEGYTVSYSQLYNYVCSKAKTMTYFPGELVPIEATPTIEFVVTYFALHLIDAVAVPFEAGLPEKRKEEIIAMFAGKKAPKGVADVLYTTGTTGKSKAVMVSHDTIFANAENLVLAQKFTRDVTFIVSGPLSHIGSLSKLYPTIFVGGTIHLVGGMKNLTAFYEAIDDAPSKVATFLVPTNIRMLLTLSKEKLASYADKIDFIETGAAPMAQTDMEALCKILPHTRLYNTYASTETGIIATYDYNEGECLAGCLGVPMKHSSFAITPEGRVCCKGKTLMMGYFGDPELTKTILKDNTIVTNDMGYIDSKGRLRLQGRGDDVINIGGFKIDPTEVEATAMQYGGVSDCVCISVKHAFTTNALKLIIVRGEGYEQKELIKFLKSRLEAYKVPLLYEEASKIHRTFNGKIDRKHYR